MEHRDETPRRRRTKRRNETRERDITRHRIRQADVEKEVEDEAVESSGDESDDEDEASSTAPPPGTTPLPPSLPPPPPPIATPPSATVTPPPASTTPDTQTIISAAPTAGTQTLESGTVSTTGQSAINTPIAAGETTDPPRAQNGAGLSRQSTGLPPAATAAIAVIGTLTSLVIVLPKSGCLLPMPEKASY